MAASLLALALLAPRARAEPGQTKLREELVAALRLERGKALVLTGDSGTEHERNALTLRFDAEGRFAADFGPGLLRDAAFDGQRAQGRDDAGRPYELLGWERDGALIVHGLASGAWLGERAGWELGRVSASMDGRDITVDARQPERLTPVHLTVDAATRRVRTAEFTISAVPRVVALREWSEGEQGVFPRLVELREGGRAPVTLRFERLEVDPAETPSFELAAEVAGAEGLEELDAVALKTLPGSTGHTFVRAAVDGKEGWFAFDTGASATVLDAAFAGELALRPVAAAIPGTGAGGAARFSAWRARVLAVGPLRVAEPLVFAGDLRRIGRAFGVELAGVLGADVLAHAAWELDVLAGEVTLHGPRSPGLSDDARWQDFRLYMRHVVVPATFEGHAGRFVVDSGGGGKGPCFNAPTVRRLALLEGRPTLRTRLEGIGGGFAVQRGILESFGFAGRELRRISADFVTTEAGSWGDPYLDGLVGFDLLQRDVVLFDYPARRIGFVERER